ncbi:phenylacetic acid degradation PaaB family protein [Halorubrum salsamenti]|uniref:phenylacetic acid degradation PaaB family protein n=1 Tax=Halorubrum salsamenti TaxID=2583990 RepID=UPI0011A05C47|nr:phenylacetic acid degradation PaaB family protein [Halorubrum salsamenti]
MKYEVFARVNQGDDTIHIGNVTAKSDRLAKVYARNTFNEEDWDRLAVVREDQLLDVTGEAKPTVEVGTQ